VGKPKIDKVKLSQMLRGGKTQRDCAKAFGVTEGAISQVKKELNINVVKSVALENAHRVVDKSLNAVDQLQKINRVSKQLLDELTGEDQTIDRMVKAVEGSLVYEGNPINQKEYIRRVILQVNRDKNTALKACAEIRGQLRLQLDIFSTLYDLQAVQDFQREVLDAIASVNPEVRDQIVRSLKERRALRGLTRIS